MALLPLSNCAVAIQDAEFCSPIPGARGAVCDHLLKDEPKTLTEAEWQHQVTLWNESGQALECTTSQTIGDLKGELEKLCSKTPCTFDTAQALNALERIHRLGTLHPKP